jgi:hypothetical protein
MDYPCVHASCFLSKAQTHALAIPIKLSKNYVANVIQIKLHFGHMPKLIVRNRANLTQVNVPYALAPKHETVKDLLSKGG